MVGESNQNVFLIQIDASSVAESEISEFELSRVDLHVYKSPFFCGFTVRVLYGRLFYSYNRGLHASNSGVHLLGQLLGQY